MNSANVAVHAFTVELFSLTHGVGKTKVYSEIKSGRLPVRKVGRRTVILKEDAMRWRQALPKKGGHEQPDIQ